MANRLPSVSILYDIRSDNCILNVYVLNFEKYRDNQKII
jgi:hypothetical protein